MGTMEVLGADPPADFEELGLWSAALVNELPPLQAVRDIRLHVLRETDSLRRMHLVQAVIHACLDELDAAPATMLDRVVRISRAVYLAPAAPTTRLEAGDDGKTFTFRALGFARKFCCLAVFLIAFVAIDACIVYTAVLRIEEGRTTLFM